MENEFGLVMVEKEGLDGKGVIIDMVKEFLKENIV